MVTWSSKQHIMLREVRLAVQFMIEILSRNSLIPRDKLDQFSDCLEKLLCSKYDKHWHPQKPFLGSAFRCIRITQKFVDADIMKAAFMSGVASSDLLQMLPQEFTVWIDPSDVSYRIGEDGSICELIITDESCLIQSCQAEVPRPTLIESSTGSAYTQCWS